MKALAFVSPPLSEHEDSGSSSPPVFDEATLWAGDLVVSTQPVRMATVLGSCVSVCLYDAGRRFGGMNHFLVPNGGDALIHGEWSTRELVAQMRREGSRPRDLQAKVFGGGSPLRLAGGAAGVGEENVAVARAVLAAEGVRIVAERLGGCAGLKVFFENWTGVAWVRSHVKGE